MYKTLSGAALAVMMTAGAASAATLTGSFTVTAVNVTNLNSSEASATVANFNAALAGTLGGVDSVSIADTFTYTGDIDFRTTDGTDATTINDWLNSGGGSIAGLDIPTLQQSTPNIGNGTATTTFYFFDADFAVPASDLTIVHDDGITILESATLVANVLSGTELQSSAAPTTEKTTLAPGFGGGDLGILYVATNGDPSILNVDVAPVPLPAPLALLLAGIAGLVGMRRMSKARAAA